MGKVLIFSTHKFEWPFLHQSFSDKGIDFQMVEARLERETACLAKGYEAVCVFVNDHLDHSVIESLKEHGVKVLLLRSAGFNHVDLKACEQNDIKVLRVPEYSPFSVAEYTVSLLQTLNRKIHRAYHRVKDLNFSLDHLVGFDLHGKTVGVIGTGKIGAQVCRILHGFGCRVLAFDVEPNRDLEKQNICEYTSLDKLVKESRILTLHVPLNTETYHLIGEAEFREMPEDSVLINTSRGGLIDTAALIQALKDRRLSGAALDVYEEEENVFFGDHSFEVLQDDTLARLLMFPNVIVTSHQAFLTKEALQGIAETTAENFISYTNQSHLTNQVVYKG